MKLPISNLIVSLFQSSFSYIYIHIYERRLRERQSNMRLAISWHQGNIISPKNKKKTILHITRYIQINKNDIYIYIIMKIERDTIKFEIGNFKILIKYYIVKKRRRYFISWDTSKTEKRDICIHEDWERDNQIWDWQFHDINEILYRQTKKTIVHCMRYIKFRIKDININEKRERETIKSEIGNFTIPVKYFIAK